MPLNPTIKHPLLILCLIFLYNSCTEIYHPQITPNFSALVVDGIITNENKPIEIKIYRTISKETVSTKDIIVPEKNAVVKIFNDLGESDTFIETAPGVYQNVSFDFRGEIGRSYWIKIKTEEGNEYESEPEVMTPPVEVTKMYGEEFSKFIDEDTEIESVRLYFDAKDETNETSFLRWEALESWEWHTPVLLNLPDSSLITAEPALVCYPTNKIRHINLFDASKLGDKEMIKLPITFITQKEQKLLYDYYIKIRVKSISFKNYNFWKHIKDINQSSGKLFDRTPGNVVGNIFSEDDKHAVVGYFEVSSVFTKSASFNKSLFSVKFDIFPSECVEGVLDIPPDTTRYYITGLGFSEHGVYGFLYRRKECFDCSFVYSPNKPSFWQ